MRCQHGLRVHISARMLSLAPVLARVGLAWDIQTPETLMQRKALTRVGKAPLYGDRRAA